MTVCIHKDGHWPWPGWICRYFRGSRRAGNFKPDISRPGGKYRKPVDHCNHDLAAAVTYLPTFGKLKSGHLRWDVILTTVIAKRSLRGRSPRFSRGVRGHAPPENFENRDCQIRIFLMFWSMILHIYCKEK